MLTTDAPWTNGLGAVLNGLGSAGARIGGKQAEIAARIYVDAPARGYTTRKEDLEILGLMEQTIERYRQTGQG